MLRTFTVKEAWSREENILRGSFIQDLLSVICGVVLRKKGAESGGRAERKKGRGQRGKDRADQTHDSAF